MKLKSILSDKWVIAAIVLIPFILGFSWLYNKSPLKLEITLDESLPHKIWLSLPYRQKPFVEFPVYWDDRYFKHKNKEYFVKILACDEFHYLTVDKNKNYYCDGEFIGKAIDKDKMGNPVKNFFITVKFLKEKLL